MAVAFSAFSVGCGSDQSKPEPAESPAGAEIRADDAEEREIGGQVQRYFLRNCPLPGSMLKIPKEARNSPYFPEYKRFVKGAEAMCGNIATIEVDGDQVTIRSDIEDDATGRAAGNAFCNLIQGSDVADFTEGHELQDIEGETIKTCPARTD